MKRKFLHDISINTLQLIIVQSCGLIIFYLLSTRLGKNEFGEINWALAVLLTSFGVLAFGIDQIAIRRIASGINAAQLLTTYIIHVLIAGCLFYFILWISAEIFPSFFYQHRLLLLLGIGKLMIFFSTPFKQLASGLEKFKPLLLMAITSNVLRALVLIIADALNQLNVHIIVTVFILSDLAELLVCVFIMQRVVKVPLKLKWNKSEYKSLVKEALPQFGVAVFTSALSRLDWIFLGILATNVILADYSFAYKVFEVATLPMLVIAPVLIPRFTKLFNGAAGKITQDKTADLFLLLRFEVIIASFVALLLNIMWAPAIDLLTDNKYGAVNSTTILLLSASMPFLYFNNFLWTVNFAQGRFKMIFYVFFISFVFNLAGNSVLIPFFKAEGAAMAYLAAVIAQSVVYFKKTNLDELIKRSYSLLLCPVAAVISSILTTTVFNILWVNLVLASACFFLLLYLTKQIRFSDWLAFKRVTNL
jgi:O-antigen/teichoic acid export membrane protein